MTAGRPTSQSERYAIEDGRYVLYISGSRALATETVALLVDTRLQRLITHGDPATVRRELDEMREALRSSQAPRYEKDWVLLEGRPDVDWLNRTLQATGRIDTLDTVFARAHRGHAATIARQLLDRLARRS